MSEPPEAAGQGPEPEPDGGGLDSIVSRAVGIQGVGKVLCTPACPGRPVPRARLQRQVGTQSGREDPVTRRGRLHGPP